MAFNAQQYLQNKAAQMNRTNEKGRSNWTISDVQKAFSEANLSAEDHYNRYGKIEGISDAAAKAATSGSTNPGSSSTASNTAPNTSSASQVRPSAGFNSGIYIQNKVAQLNQKGEDGRTDWTVEDVEKALADSDLTAQQHYNRYGVLEGVTPYATRPTADVPSTSVSSSQTSAGQLKGLLAGNSPLMQQAATMGRQQSAQRGLLNSSMAGQAAQGAMIASAAPFAQQDAQTYYNNSQANAQRQQQAYMANLQHQQQLELNQQQFGFQSQLNEQGFNFDTQKLAQQFSYDTQLSQQEASQALNNLYATSTANAWGVMANNLTDLVGQSASAIQQIQVNPDITAENKQTMIKQILDMRNTDIEFQQSLYENLGTYLKNTGVFPDLA